jgi:hypothetical protein
MLQRVLNHLEKTTVSVLPTCTWLYEALVDLLYVYQKKYFLVIIQGQSKEDLLEDADLKLVCKNYFP